MRVCVPPSWVSRVLKAAIIQGKKGTGLAQGLRNASENQKYGVRVVSCTSQKTVRVPIWWKAEKQDWSGRGRTVGLKLVPFSNYDPYHAQLAASQAVP